MLQLAALVRAQQSGTSVVHLPRQTMTRIPSPDRHWTLISPAFCSDCDRRLTLKDNHTRRQRTIKTFNRSLAVSWAPDSRAFFLNDELASDETDAYVYRPRTAKPLDLNRLILVHDPKAHRFLHEHTYFEARRWIDHQAVLVALCGHTSEAPAKQFSLTYRVDLQGSVKRVSVSENEVSDQSGPDCSQ